MKNKKKNKTKKIHKLANSIFIVSSALSLTACTNDFNVEDNQNINLYGVEPPSNELNVNNEIEIESNKNNNKDNKIEDVKVEDDIVISMYGVKPDQEDEDEDKNMEIGIENDVPVDMYGVISDNNDDYEEDNEIIVENENPVYMYGVQQNIEVEKPNFEIEEDIVVNMYGVPPTP